MLLPLNYKEMKKLIFLMLVILFSSSFIKGQDLIYIPDLNYYSDPTSSIPSKYRVSNKRFFRIEAQDVFVNCKTGYKSNCVVKYLASNNTWVALDGMWYYTEGDQIPRFRIWVSNSLFWDGIGLPVGYNSKSKYCVSYPYSQYEDYGTAKIGIHPILNATILTKQYNLQYPGSGDKYLNSIKFTDGDDIYFDITQSGDNCTLITKEKIGSNSSQTVSLQSKDGLKYKKIMLPSGSSTTNVIYYFQGIKGGSYSFDIANVSVTVYPKPTLSINSIFYSCNNQINHIKYRITSMPSGEVHVILAKKVDSDYTPVGGEITYTATNLNKDLPISALVAQGNEISPGEYQIVIRNIFTNAANERRASGYTFYNFTIAPPPDLNLSGNSDVTVSCIGDKANITINPGTAALNFIVNNPDYSIQYGIEKEVVINPGLPGTGGFQLLSASGSSQTYTAWQTSNTFSNIEVGTHTFYCKYVSNGVYMCTTGGYDLNVTSTYSKNVKITNVTSDISNICNGTQINLNIYADYDATVNPSNVYIYYQQLSPSAGGLVRATTSHNISVKVNEGQYRVTGYYTGAVCPATAVTKPAFVNDYTPLSLPNFYGKNMNYCENNDYGKGEIGADISGGLGILNAQIIPSGAGNTFSETNVSSPYNYDQITLVDDYFLKITDSRGCYAFDEVDISVVNEFKKVTTNPTVKKDVDYCTANSNGRLTVNFTGGNGLTNYSYTLYKYNTSTGQWDIYNIPSSHVTRNVTSCVFDLLPPGEYKAKLQLSGASCSLEFDPVTIILQNEFRINNYVSAPIVGCTANGGTFDASVLNGTKPFTFNLYKQGVPNAVQTKSGDSGTISFAINEPGYYKVKASSSECPEVEKQSSYDNLNSISNPVDLDNITFNNVTTCNGDASGSIQLSLLNTTGSLLIKLSGAATAQTTNPNYTFTPLKAGDYTINVTDKNCTFTKSAPLSEPAKLNFTNTKKDAKCDASDDGEIHFTSVTQGTQTLTRANCWFTTGSGWSHTYDYTGLEDKDYTLYVSTDASGGCKSDPVSVTVGAPNPITATFDTVNYHGYAITCHGSSSGTLTWSNLTGGNGGYAIHKSKTGDDGAIPITGTSWTGFSAGTYNIWVTDTKNCSSSVTPITFIEPLVLQISNLSQTPANCASLQDGSISFNISGGVPNFDISYTKGIITTNLPSTSSRSITIPNLYQGTYDLTVTDANSCNATSSETITALNSPTISLTPTNVNCYGDHSGQIRANASFQGHASFDYKLDNGSYQTAGTSYTFSSLTTGNHTVYVKETGRNCESHQQTNLTQPASALTISSSSFQNTSTATSSDGWIKITLTGGTPNYSLALSGPVSETKNNVVANSLQTFSNLPAGNYTITITDANGCGLSYNRSISGPSTPLAFSVNSSQCLNVSCKGDATGRIVVNASGGWGNYRYSLNGVGKTLTNVTYSTFNGLKAGTYSLSVTDNLGATLSTQYTITEPAQSLTAVISNIQNVNCKNDATGSFKFTVSGGSLSGFKYNFNNQGLVSYTTPVTFTGLPAANYSYTVQDGNGCQYSNTQPITEPAANLQPIISVNNYNGYNIRCIYGTDEIKVSATGGTANYSFDLNGNKFNGVGSGVIKNYTNLPAGAYQVMITDNHLCTASTNVTLTEPENELALSAKNFTEPVCSDEQNATLSLTGTGGTSALNYTVSITGKGTLNKNISETLVGKSVNFNTLFFGKYYINLSDANSCQLLDSVTITQPNPVDFTITRIENINCFGESTGEIDLQITGGRPPYRYRLNDGSVLPTGATLNLTGLTAQIHKIEVFDQSNCSVIKTQPLTQPDKLVAQVNLNNYNDSSIRCNGLTDTAFVSASGGFGNYILHFNSESGTFTSNTFIPDLTAGDYQITVTDAYNCSDIVDFHLSQPDQISIDTIAVTPAKCSGTNTGRALVNVLGGIQSQPYIYSFSGISGTVYNNTVTDNANTLCTGLIAGNYRILVTDDNQCVDTKDFVIEEPNNISISFDIQPVNCKGSGTGIITAAINGGNAPYSLDWINSAHDTIGHAQQIISLSAGDYTLIVKDANQCNSSGQLVLPSAVAHVPEPAQALSVTVSDFSNPLCFGDENGTITVQASGGWQKYNYTINDIAEVSAPNYVGLGAGNYWIVVTDSMLCSDTTNIELIQNHAVEIASLLADSVICYNQSNGIISVVPLGGNGIYTYSLDHENWQTNSIFTGLAADNYTVYVKDSNECTTSRGIPVYEPDALAISQDSVINSVSCRPSGKIALTATGGTVPYQFLWDEHTGYQTGNIADSLDAGSYSVTVTDHKSCTAGFIGGIINQKSLPAIKLVAKHDATCKTTADGNVEISVIFDGPVQIRWTNNEMPGWEKSGNKIDQLLPGTYTTDVFTEGQCHIYRDFVISSPEDLKVVLSSVPVDCKGLQTGSALAQISGGIAPYQVIWENNAGDTVSTGEQLVHVYTGFYKIKINDQTTCAGPDGYVLLDSVQVVEPAEMLDISPTFKQDATCNGDTDGRVQLSATGGNGAWRFADATKTYSFNSTFNQLEPGDHWFYVKDLKNCADSVQVTVHEPASLETFIDNTINVSCNNYSDGEIKASAAGGWGKYRYQLNGGAFTATSDFSNLGAGNYWVMVKDSLGCTHSQSVEITQPDSLKIAKLITDSTTCYGDANGSVAVSAIGGTGTYEFSLDQVNWKTDTVFGLLTAKNYKVYVHDEHACTYQADMAVPEPDDIRLSQVMITPTVSCADNGSILVEGVGGTAPYTYVWDANAGNQTGNEATGLGTGIYSLIITDTKGCTKQLTAGSVSRDDEPVVNLLELKDATCKTTPDGFVQIEVANYGLAQVTWLNASDSSWHKSGMTADSLLPGIYTAKIFTEGECYSYFDYKVSAPEDLWVQLNQTPADCKGKATGSLHVNISGGLLPYVIAWENSAGDTISNQRDVEQLVSGYYTIKVDDSTTCAGSKGYVIKDSIRITEPDKKLNLTTLMKQDITCTGFDDGLLTLQAVGGNGLYHFADSAKVFTNQALYNHLNSGQHWYFVNDQKGCTDSLPITIVEPPVLVASIDDTVNVSCYGFYDGEIKASATGGWGSYSYKLNNITSAYPDFTGVPAGSYKVVIADSLNCSDSLQVDIHQNDPVDITSVLADSTTCYGSSDGNIEVTASGGTGIYSYSLNGSLWQNNPVFANKPAGNYAVYLRDQNLCTTQDSVVVFQPAIISIREAVIKNTIACDNNGQITLTARGGKTPYQFYWDSNTGYQEGPVASNLGTGVYYVTISDVAGCHNLLTAGTINRMDGPEISLVDKQSSTCKTTPDGSIEIVVDYENGALVTWQIPDSLGGNINGPKAENLLPGIYVAQILTEGKCYSYYMDTIGAPDDLEADLITQNVACKGLSTGSIQATFAGGIEPYEFAWESADHSIISNESVLQNIPAGLYYLKINDQSSCPKVEGYNLIKSVAINEPVNYVDLTQTAIQHNSCYQSNNAYVQLKGSGGQGNWQYADSTLSFTSERLFHNLAKGNHWFYVKDMANCRDSLQVTINEPDLLRTGITAIQNVTCYGLQNGSVTLNASGGTAPYQYKLDGLNTFSSANQFINLLQHNYQSILKDALNCVDTLLFAIIQPDALSIHDILVKDSWCSEPNGEISIKVNGGTSPYLVVWNDKDSQVGMHAKNLSEGSYTADVSDGHNCELSKSYELINYEEPHLVVERVEPATCSYTTDGTVTLTMTKGSAPFNFNWFGVVHTDSLSSDSLGKGKYKIQVADVHNCTDSKDFTIKAPDKLYISDTLINQPLCYNYSSGNITITAIGGTPEYQYSWSNNTGTLENSSLKAGEYMVTISDEHNCMFIESYQLYYPEELKVASIDKKDSWCSEPNGFIKLYAKGGTGNYTYRWIEPVSKITDSIANLNAGIYSAVITDENNCERPVEVTLQDVQAPRLSIAGLTDASCSYQPDGSIQLKVDQGTPPFTYDWGDHRKTSSNSNSGYKKGSYQVQVTDAHNCADTLPFTINAPDSLFVILDGLNDPTCFNYSDGFLGLKPVGGTSPYSYSWNNGIASALNDHLKAGTYGVEVRDAHNCATNESYYLVNPEPVVVNLEKDAAICSNQTVTLDAGNYGSWFTWYYQQKYLSSAQKITVNKAGTYFVEVRNYNNCLGTDSILVNVSESEIDANFLLQSEAYEGDTIVMIEISWPMPEDVTWNFPESFNLIRNDYSEIEFIPTQAGTFPVGLTTYRDICTEYTEKELIVKPIGDKPVGEQKKGYTHIINEVKVTPVPTHGPFNLEIELNEEHDVRIEIMHLSGIKVFTKELSGNKHYILNFSSSGYAEGIHTINVIAGNEMMVKKLVILK